MSVTLTKDVLYADEPAEGRSHGAEVTVSSERKASWGASSLLGPEKAGLHMFPPSLCFSSGREPQMGPTPALNS